MGATATEGVQWAEETAERPRGQHSTRNELFTSRAVPRTLRAPHKFPTFPRLGCLFLPAPKFWGTLRFVGLCALAGSRVLEKVQNYRVRLGPSRVKNSRSRGIGALRKR